MEATMIDWVWSAVGNMATWWAFGVLVLIVLAFWFGWFVPKKKAFGNAQTFDARIGGFKPSALRPLMHEPLT
jgi:ABC-type multidrug transport system permease subunit